MQGVSLLWALALLPIAAPATLNPYYVVVIPAIIHHLGHEKVCIHLSSLPETVHLAVTLEMQTQNHTLMEKDVEKPGIFECISFKVPAFVPRGKQFNEPAEEVASVHAVIHMGDRVSYEGRKKVLVRRQKTRIVIDTDKPFYKPGETVKFRIVTLDEDFKAIDKVHPLVLLQDPHGNRISQWVDVKPRQGIVDLSFPLASEAATGKYQIKVGKDMPQGLEATFKVEEYELPKFELVFNVPPLVTTSEEEFQFTVCGRYTYGKPVQGKIEVILARSLFNLHEKEENITLSTCTVDLVNQTNKKGCAIFTVDMDELEINSTGYGNSFFIVAELEEEGTGATNMGIVTVAIATKVVEVTFVNLNPFYKLGFPYTGKMRFTINDVPIKNHTVYLTVDVNDVEMHLPYVTDEKGEVHFSLDTAKWNNTLVSLRGRYSIVNITERDLHTILVAQKEAYNWLKPFYSESNSFLEIQQVEEELPCDQEQEVRVDYILDRNELGPGADHVDFYYLVVSRGRIVLSGQTQVPVGQDETLKGSFSLTLPISSELAPSATLLVYAIFADGEVAADVDVFIVSKCFKHKVTLDFSEEEDLPGSKVNLHLKADPGSLCSVRALDKSVLLKDDRVMTPESVYNLGSEEDYMIGGRGFVYHLEDFEPYPCLPPVLPFPTTPRNRRSLMVAPWYQSEADVYSLFKQLRMKILTNTKVKKPVSCERPTYERRILHADRTQDSDNVIPLPVPQPHDGVAPSPEKEKKTKPRTHFPETWIWDLFPVGEEGKASLQATAPDTITEWQADMFCVADSGFGLSQPAKFRVFQPFFVDVTLPYSVVREETFTLKATVFNYLKDCIQVHTSLAESPELQVESCSGCQYTSCLCANEAKTFSWNVTATKLGKVNVTVSTEALESHDLCGNEIAVTPPRGQTDTVIKSLLVKPGGVLEEKTHNVFLCATEDPVTDEVSLKLPEGVLEGSGRATVSVIGDIMGTALQNLHQLLRLPFGCGEQNMVMFAPNIFVLQYLEKTKQATTEIRDKALKFMKTGYQRQLLYKHDNGSYSAFGKHDAEGNTWLTAFVARSFGQASSYLYIDERHIQDAVRWLGQNQLPSGCFQSVGKLFNNALKGGVDDEISLTAYITAALLELHLEKNGTMVDDALLCLKKASHDVNSIYAQALMAYVFTLAKDMETRQQLLEPLDQLAGQLGGHLPQANDEDSSEEVIEDSSSSIETMAYILLTHISKPEVSAAEISATSQIVRWLTHQRNPYGGFASTQDTVVALQALARYAALTYHEAEGVKVTVQAKEGSQQEFHVDKKNQLVLQQASLPQVPGEYVVQAVGNGCAYVQTTLRYNVPPPESKATFVLDVKTAPEECNHAARKRFDLHVQVSYVGDRESSNMALIEVMMLSGFVPVKKSLKKVEKMPLVKKTEVEPSKLTIYLEELDKSPISFNFSVKQEIEVQNLKPATVTVYDYYQPGDSAITEYNAPCSSDVKKEDSQ